MGFRRINDIALQEWLARAEPLVVLFTNPEHVPSREARDEIRMLAKAYDDIEFVEIDLEEHPGLSSRYSIEAVPTTVVFLLGTEAIRHVGTDVIRTVRMALGGDP